jgi:hypothetical protein
MPSITVAIVTALLIWRPEHPKHLLYPMADFAALWTVALGIWFLILVTKEDRKSTFMAPAVLALGVANLSSALLLFPIACLALLLRKRYLAATLYVVAGAVVIPAYMSQIRSTSLLANLLEFPDACIRFALGVLGSGTSSVLPTGAFMTAAAGAVIALLVALVILWSKPSERVATKAVWAFMLACCVTIGIGRGPGYAKTWESAILDGYIQL